MESNAAAQAGTLNGEARARVSQGTGMRLPTYKLGAVYLT